MSLTGSTYFGFAQNTIYDFQKRRIELIVALSSTNAIKKTICTAYVCKTSIRPSMDMFEFPKDYQR